MTAAVCIAAFLGCSGSDPVGPPIGGSVGVTTAMPVKAEIVEWDQFTGRLDAIDSVEVRARVSGYLLEAPFEEGQMVREGDVLARIDARPFEAQLNAAEAQLQEAKARHVESQAVFEQSKAEKANSDAKLTLADQRLSRATRLLRQNAASEDEFDEAESSKLQAEAEVAAATARIESANAGVATALAAIETAKAVVEAAELDLQYTIVTAPITGRVSRRLVTEGNLISGGSNQSTLLTTIVSINPIHCYFDANEQDYLKYARLAENGKRGSSRDYKNPVYVALVDEEGYPHLGHMDFVDNKIDPNTGTMRGRAILPNPDGLLSPGLFARVRIPGSG
ncbi:MAG: efflux RND transporter periplasmic adaptor subunit, partial [Planctomycetota bacterium]